MSPLQLESAIVIYMTGTLIDLYVVGHKYA